MLKEAHYWAEIRGDDSLLNSFSPGLSFILPFFCFILFISLPSLPFLFLSLSLSLSLLERDPTLMKFTFSRSWHRYSPSSSVYLLSVFS